MLHNLMANTGKLFSKINSCLLHLERLQNTENGIFKHYQVSIYDPKHIAYKKFPWYDNV